MKVFGHAREYAIKMPKSIVSDRDPIFISSFWQQLFKAHSTTLAMTSTYHPHNDGQTEVLNKTLEMYHCCYIFDNAKTWHSMIPWTQFWYNSSFQHSLRMSPFKALYGRNPPLVAHYGNHSGTPIDVQESLKTKDALLHQLKANLQRAQNYMKQVNKHRRELQYEVGDLVLVKL